LVFPLTERGADHFGHKVSLGRDGLGDVTFKIFAPSRHFIIR